ncbi:MAG: SH3 domain-containing protein [Treponema sp.]|jgi:hypothetical protein|nr:SH3 domain-containing protein [Treponema sp.]
MRRIAVLTAFFITGILLLGSCGKTLGWGMLLWSLEDPEIPSGTVLPVYIRSNIDLVWVAGFPPQYKSGRTDQPDKFEIPLSQLELVGSRNAAIKRAEEFKKYALLYAETLQDGLPIREGPDNSSRRVYRLRGGEIVKILTKIEGIPAISTTGEPLPGDWYQVLTEDGNRGCCFSYRLRLFEHQGGPLNAGYIETAETEDPELDMILSENWYPESYGDMISADKIDLEELDKKWKFFTGADAGLARIFAPGLNRTFSYTGITKEREHSWHFDGSSLQMTLRGDSLLAVQYADDGGAVRTLLFVTLPSSLEDLVVREIERRNTLYQSFIALGPEFSSANYGIISFNADGRFTWNGNSLLIPGIIPSAALGAGAVDMRLYLGAALQGRSQGAFTLRFDGAGSPPLPVHFLYTLDEQGLRLEHVPEENLNGVTVERRSASPTVIFFFKMDG